MKTSLFANRFEVALVPVSITATQNGLTIDRRGYGEVTLVALQGICGDTLDGSNYWTISFQHGDESDLSDAADIPAAQLLNGSNSHVINAAAEDPTEIRRTYIGTKRYVRIVWTETGALNTGTPVAGLAVLGNPNSMPASQPTELGG